MHHGGLSTPTPPFLTELMVGLTAQILADLQKAHAALAVAVLPEHEVGHDGGVVWRARAATTEEGVVPEVKISR